MSGVVGLIALYSVTLQFGVIQLRTLVDIFLSSPDGLAVDWISDKLYWVDADTAKIEVANLDGSNRTVLFANNIGILRAIVVDPTTRLVSGRIWKL